MRRLRALPYLTAAAQSGESSPHSKAPPAPTSCQKVWFTYRPCGFPPPARRSPHESGGEAALGVRRLCAAFGLLLTSWPHPKAVNNHRTPRRLRRPRPGGRYCSLAGHAASPYCPGVVPMKAAAKPPLECGAYAPPSGFALPHGCSPKRRRIAALQGAFGAHVLAEGIVHSPAMRLPPIAPAQSPWKRRRSRPWSAAFIRRFRASPYLTAAAQSGEGSPYSKSGRHSDILPVPEKASIVNQGNPLRRQHAPSPFTSINLRLRPRALRTNARAAAFCRNRFRGVEPRGHILDSRL